ncbi:MAG: amidase, partial [Gaiellales bacterium]
MSDGLLGRSAVELGALLQTRELSPVELLEAQLERIDGLNPQLNAIVTLRGDGARAEAVAAERRAARGRRRGPLDGIPFTVKDVIATAGMRTTMGSRLFADHIPTWTAPAVARLQGVGAILVGKTNCPEFGLDPHTDNLLFGPTLNPLDAARTPGGSSGGEGSAVAAGLAGFGIGSDYGGSLRWPAQCNGIHALRPTPGLVPGTGLLPSDGTLSMLGPSSVSLLGAAQVIGPLARSVGDLSAVLEAIAGAHTSDPRSVPVAARPVAGVDVGALACAWLDGEGAFEVSDELVVTVEGAATALAGSLSRVEAARPAGFERAEPIYAAYRAADGLSLHRQLAAGREDELTDTMRTWFSEVRSAGVDEFQDLAAQRDRLRADVLEFMDTFP